MIVIFIRTLIIYVTLVVIMRLMGKRQIGEMQPYEFIVTLIIADLACIPMADVSIPLTYGIAGIFALFILHQILSLLEQSNDFFKKIISGKPSVVINKNGVDLVELKKNNMNVDDLIESMRTLGYFSLDQLNYAIYESNGKLSAFEKNEQSESGSQMEKNGSSLPLVIVNEGKAVKRNLTLINCEQKTVEKFIKNANQKMTSTEVMTVDGNGRVYLKCKKQKYQILNNFPLKEGVSW